MISARQRATRLDYCQFLLSSQVNYTLTHFADHSRQYSHDQLNRYLRDDKLTPRLVWEQVKGSLVMSPDGYLLFDDTVADKNYSREIEVVRRQYSGNAKSVIRGIGIFTCVYVNLETAQFRIVDYRIFDPDRDGKTKLDHVREMLDHTIEHKQLPFRCVLMDAWYATRPLMLHIERAGKIYYCPLKDNRQVAEPDATAARYLYQRADALEWSEQEAQAGRLVYIKDFPAGHQVRLFRLVLSTERTDYVVTNDPTQARPPTPNRCVPSVGRLSSFTAKPSN